MPWARRGTQARVADYVKRASLADKVSNMYNNAGGIDALHIPPYQWGSEGLHGPLEPGREFAYEEQDFRRYQSDHPAVLAVHIS